MQYNFIKEKISRGHKVRRLSWTNCMIVRAAEEADEDHINYPHTGLFVSSCDMRSCDCKIAIYNPTPADEMADDWVVIKEEPVTA